MNLYKLIIAVFVVFASILLFANKYEAKAAIITVSGNTLTYKGGVDEGDAKKFKRLFTSNIKKLILNSPGGFMKEALAMSKLISKRYDVTIYAEEKCTSACAVMWISGHNQVKPKEKIVGFHLPYIPDIKHIKEQQDKYGLNGLEYMFKKSAIGFLVNVTPYIDNKSAVHMFTKGLQDKGLLSYNMWYPKVSELRFMEGKFSKPNLFLKLTDSNKWATVYSFKNVKTEYINGIWKTKITIRYSSYSKKLYLTLYTGSGSKAKQIGVGSGKSHHNFKTVSYKLETVNYGEDYIYRLQSKIKPELIQLKDSDGNKVWTYI